MANVDLYSTSYGHYALKTYGEIRRETYGEDYGQTSWMSTAESHEIPELLKLSNKPSVLEIGCGSGRLCSSSGKILGCRILGFDINPKGVRTANHLAEQAKLGQNRPISTV